jgi:hypothetical protein
MDKTKEERKSALKLINKYAHSYTLLEEENKKLKREINDLKLNLKINKDIIENFYSGKNTSELSNLIKINLKEQSDFNNDQLESLTKERDDLRYRLMMMDQMQDESTNSIKSENEKLKSKIFAMDNCLLKKDNIIQQLKKKLEFVPKDKNAIEIYIADPSQVSVKMHEELAVYKEIYTRLMNSIKDLKSTLHKYEKIIHDLQLENTKLTHEMKYELNQKYEREREDLDQSSVTTAIRGNTTSKTVVNVTAINTSVIKPVGMNKSASDIQLAKPSMFTRKYYELEEWWLDALKSSSMDEGDFKKFKNNRAFAKIVDLIEFLNNIILDKNFQIKMIEKENHMLNDKYDQLNKENISLYQQIKDFANTKEDSSMHNNLSNNLMGASKSGLGLLKNYEITMESVNSGDFAHEVIDMNYFTVESDHVKNISIN